MPGLALANGHRGREPVHHGHLHVHQRHVERAALVRLDRLLAVVGDDGNVAHLFQQAHDQPLVDRVVFRDQHVKAPRRRLRAGWGWRRRRGLHLDRLTEGQKNGVEQLGRREGLDQMTRDAQRAAAREIAVHHVRRQQHHRHAGQGRLSTDALGHGEAVDVRHAGVEEDQAERAPGGPCLFKRGQG